MRHSVLRTIQTLIFLLIVGAMSVLPTRAWATRETHGGGALKCTGSVQKALEFLDLAEARERKLTIVESALPPEQQAELALSRITKISSRLGAGVRKSLGALKKNQKTVKEHLASPPDSNLLYLYPGCELESVGLYERKTKTLWISPLLAQMSPTSQAAFWIHEAIYLTLRSMEGAEASTEARALTGFAFSAEVDQQKDLSEALPTKLRVIENLKSQWKTHSRYREYQECDLAKNKYAELMRTVLETSELHGYFKNGILRVYFYEMDPLVKQMVDADGPSLCRLDVRY